MSIIDDYLEKHNLKYEDLTPEEQVTLSSWVDSLQQGQLSNEKIREYISAMKDSIAKALCDEPEYNWVFTSKIPNRKHLELKARLKNYILLESFLTTPDRAKKALEKALARMKK